MRIKPRNGLQEGLLLGKLLLLDSRVSSDGKAVLGAGEEVDLVRLLGLDENLLGLVALLGGENAVRLGGGNGQRAGDGGELILVDKGRVCAVADVDSVLVVADDVLLSRKDVQSVKRDMDGGVERVERFVRTLAPKQ